MGRVIRALALAAGGLTLAGCSSWLPSWDFSVGSPTPATGTLNVDSEPPGAEAKASLGPGCVTPCALTVSASSEFTVSFALSGYLPQTVPVRPRAPEDPREAGTLQFAPNPVHVQLAPAPPPPGKKKAKTVKRRPPAKPPAPG